MTELALSSHPSSMNRSQRAVFDRLLEVGGTRPVPVAGIVDEIARELLAGTAEPVRRWMETASKPLKFSKSMVSRIRACEGCVVAEAATPQGGSLVPAHVAVGTVAHRACEIACTFPGRSVSEYVDAAIEGSIRADTRFAETWREGDLALQADIHNRALSMLTAFMDSWPRFGESWTVRWEEPTSARIGNLVLTARFDLLFGRPVSDRQTLVIVTLKTGPLKPDEHRIDAGFYALTSALRWAVPPLKSAVYSLAEGEWEEGPGAVTADWLLEATEIVCDAVHRYVEVMTEVREPAPPADPSSVWHSSGCQFGTDARSPDQELLVP